MKEIVKKCKKHGDLTLENIIGYEKEGKKIYRCRICNWEQASKRREKFKSFNKTGICKIHGKIEDKYVGHHAFTKNGRTEIRKRCKLCHRKTANQAFKLNPERIEKKNAQSRLRYSLTSEKEKERSKVKYRKFRTRAMERQIKNRYGLDPVDYRKMVEDQNNKCKICGNEETRKWTRKSDIAEKSCRLTIDHCHDTGKIRGLLCHRCNVGIGSLKHDIELMLKAIEYLKQ